MTMVVLPQAIKNVLPALGNEIITLDVYKRQKPFSVGARIEHLRQKVDKAQYGRFAGNKKLGSANYKLSTHLDNGRAATSVYS